MATFPRSTLARNHLRVVESAPADMRPRMVSRACSILYRASEDATEFSREAMEYVLDAEDFASKFGLVNY